MSKSYKFRVGQTVHYNNGTTTVDVTITGISYSGTKGQFYALSNGQNVKHKALTAMQSNVTVGKIPPAFPLPGEQPEDWPDAPAS